MPLCPDTLSDVDYLLNRSVQNLMDDDNQLMLVFDRRIEVLLLVSIQQIMITHKETDEKEL